MSDNAMFLFVFAAYALPMYREGRFRIQSALRRMKKDRKDAKASKKPEMPHTGPGLCAFLLPFIHQHPS